MSLQKTILNLDENGRKFSKQIENTGEKGEVARYEQFLFFPTEFSKELYCRYVKRWEKVNKTDFMEHN